jgi:hypothetical protein
MVDIDATLRAKLVSNNALVALVGARIYAAERLPAGYKPSDGPAVLFKTNSGTADYGPTLRPTIQVRCYGLDESTARATDQLVFDALHEMRSGNVLMVELDVLGQMLADPETDWRFVLSYYRAQIVNN